MVKRIQREVTLSITQRHDFVHLFTYNTFYDKDTTMLDNISFRCVSQRIDTFGGSHEGKVKRHPVTSATCVRVRIDDERAGPPPSSIHTYKQSWISTTTTTTPLGNAPETYHRCFANVNGPQYYYFSSQIKPDDIDSCGLYCLYYFKRRHRGTWTQFYDLMLTLYIVMHCNCRHDRMYRNINLLNNRTVKIVFCRALSWYM
jgi:hypothetical protein